ncbi:MAG: RagB/SusD family nutrient uptake outer membrane protein [Pseudopedobacter saltans]|uniref:RagB/SusD family nutrient uptake outer membrane protein n=1 Tax=Pseudopedobacter saltans TaxID=151895 RepID=A0A2W5F8I4_9SPHI|nr:MAG: RagB/SusD family nutrient uptake outer membrane protein [Pseudopedobacter saltans]
MKTIHISQYIKLSLLSASMIWISSCNKFLDKSPVSDLTTENFYKTVNDAESGLVGAYNGLGDQYYIWDFISNSDARSDNAYAGGDNPDNFQIDNFTVTATNGNVSRDWSGLYTQIGKANAVIDNVPNISDALFSDPNRKEQIISEAKFLRAFHYYNLVTTYGKLPLVTSLTQDYYPSRSEVNDVYTQIISDLKDADQYLADPGKESETGRATKGAAEALLAKVYAQMGDYVNCLDYCNKVLSWNYSLVSNYDYLFDGNHENSSESIFEIQHMAGTFGSYGPNMMLPASITGEAWVKFNTPTQDLVKAMRSEGDSIRLHSSIVFDNTSNLPSPYTAAENPIPYVYKYRNPNGWSSPNNEIMIRLADIILLKAEALNSSTVNRSSEAIPLINQIRTRVNLPAVSPSTQSDIKVAILKERRFELAFEGQRWNDLLRAGSDYTIQLMNSQVKGDGSSLNYSVNNNKLIFPVPQSERNKNPNLDQNAGY